MKNTEIKYMTIPFECKALSDPGQFEGYGSVFDIIDMGDDVVMKGAFTKTLKEWNERKQLPVMPWQHNMSNLIGQWESMAEDAKGLKVVGTLWVEGNKFDQTAIEQAAVAHNLLRSNGPKQLSIGWSATKVSFGEKDGRRVRFLEEVKLWELSVVPFGMNQESDITNAKNADGALPSVRELEQVLRDAGLSKSNAQTVLSKGYRALDQSDSGMLGDSLENIKQITKLLKGE